LIKKIFAFLLFVILTTMNAQEITNSFTHFSELDGLPSEFTGPIIQDHLGYIWIGTLNGLSRYDGYEFLNYSPVKNDSNFLQLSIIESLYEDTKGDLWIGAVGGITKYNRKDDTFKLYSVNLNENDYGHEFVASDIIEASNGDMIFTTMGYNYSDSFLGLYILEKDSSIIKPAINLETNSLLNINHIEGDKYFISGFKGLGEYNNTQKTVKWFPFRNPTQITSVLLTDHKLWLGTYNKGLIDYNIEDSTYTTYPILESIDFDTDFFVITDIILENNNLIFTSNKGLFGFNSETKKHVIAEVNPLNPVSMNSENLSGLEKDYSGSIWITSPGRGISKYDATRSNFKAFKHDPNILNGVSPGWVGVIYEHKLNEIWLQSNWGEISVYNAKKDLFPIH